MMDGVAEKQFWWGRFPVPIDASGYWRIGPLHLWAQHSASEWRLATLTEDRPLDSTLAVEIPATHPEPEEPAFACRYGFRQAPDAIRLKPALADRPIMIRASSSFVVPPGEELELFISSALWVQIFAGEDGQLLREEPSARPTDTWFGPSPMVGELCYASRTYARSEVANLPIRPHRAVSAVRIRNRTDCHLPLARLKLPAPNMSLFFTADGRLWTETVILESEDEGDLAILQLSKSPPARAEGAQRICGPRAEPEKGLLMRAFGSVLRGGM